MNIYLKSTILSLCALAAASTFVACDNVPEDERLIPVQKPDVARKVLIQEFTGQRCPNCPEGAAAVKDIQENYPGSVISVNLHPLGTSYTRPVGGLKLTSEIATTYYNYYKPTAFPAAVINGATPNSNTTLWYTLVSAQLGIETPVELNLTTDYDASTRKLIVKYAAVFNDLHAGELNINIWLTESGIVGPQYTNGPRDENYVHNHVARTSLTGDWGLPMGNSFVAMQVVEGEVSCILDDSWVAENCGIVAFVQNPANKNVNQVEEAELFPESEEE